MPKHRMIVRVCISVCVFALASTVLGGKRLDTQRLVSDPLSCALLDRDYIYAETQGTVPVRFSSAISVFKQDDFLSRVQEEYGKILPVAQSPEFIIQQSATNVWFYINKKQERTDITEVAGGPSGTEAYDLVYYTAGRRFFGRYQALIHIHLARREDKTAYTVAVYAYPENGCCRFFVQHLPPVENYFRSKTGELTKTAVQLCAHLCTPEHADTLAQSGF